MISLKTILVVSRTGDQGIDSLKVQMRREYQFSQSSHEWRQGKAARSKNEGTRLINMCTFYLGTTYPLILSIMRA